MTPQCATAAMRCSGLACASPSFDIESLPFYTFCHFTACFPLALPHPRARPRVSVILQQVAVRFASALHLQQHTRKEFLESVGI